MTALCVGDCRPPTKGGPRQSAHGQHLCSVCVDRMWENLHAIAEAWPDIEARLGVESSASQNSRVQSTPTPGLTINEAVSNTMGQARAWLEFVARVVVDERNLTAGPPDQTAPGLATWLASSHIDWLGRHPDEQMAASFSLEAAAHHRDVKRAAYPSGARRLDLPKLRCVEHDTSVEGERVPCDGTLYAMILPWSTTMPDLICTVDSTHEVEPGTWLRPGWKRHIDPASVARLLGRVTG